MDSNKSRNGDTKKANRDDKQGIVKLEEQVEKVCTCPSRAFSMNFPIASKHMQ